MSADDLRVIGSYMATHYRLDDVDLQIVIPATGDSSVQRATRSTAFNGARILVAIDPQTARSILERARRSDHLTW